MYACYCGTNGCR
uniref:Uncharacterized protein n=1 Tax=Arundo donax TaxID=35708 RepID=A0A0A9HI72_ARUDO